MIIAMNNTSSCELIDMLCGELLHCEQRCLNKIRIKVLINEIIYKGVYQLLIIYLHSRSYIYSGSYSIFHIKRHIALQCCSIRPKEAFRIYVWFTFGLGNSGSCNSSRNSYKKLRSVLYKLSTI